MISLKSCPRCQGDLVEREDSFGRYRQCVQCGAHSYISSGNRHHKVKATRYGKSVYERFNTLEEFDRKRL